MSQATSIAQLLTENGDLRRRLQEAEDTLEAIRSGGIDALVVEGVEGDQIYTLSGEDAIYRRLVETMNEAGLTTTPDGTILFCNLRFSQCVRLPIEAIIGQPLERFIDGSSHLALARLMERVQVRPCTERLVFCASDGTRVPMYTSANLLIQGESVSVCLVAADLTDLEAIHNELKKRADQLARLASELTLTEQRERHRLAKMLHDHLQQLLVGAKFGIEALKSHLSDSLHAAALGDIYELIQESIATSRSLTVELSPTILHEAGLAAGIEWLARQMEQKNGLAVEVQAVDVPIDREDILILLFESVRELLLNAVKHSGVTRAQVCLRRTPETIDVIVSDEGIGFDPGQLDARGDEMATGFGLFSIRERLELIGGRLTIHSAPQHGSTFTLTVPYKPIAGGASVPADGRPGLRPAGKTADAAHPIRVLVTDDHAVVRQGICGLLKREKDLDVIGEATDGQQAVEMSRRLKPDVILMDFNMPRMDGVEATRAIHAEMPEITIIGLSMYSEADRAKAMYDAGAAGYVSKSDQFTELVTTIRAAASRK